MSEHIYTSKLWNVEKLIQILQGALYCSKLNCPFVF